MPRSALVLAAAALAGVVSTAWPAGARCVGEFVRVWPAPEAGPAPTNTRLLAHAGGGRWSTADVSTLRLVPARGRPIALGVAVDQMGGDGARPQRMVVLAPERELAPHTRYALAGGALARGLGYSITTGADADVTAPAAGGASAGTFAAAEFGCGPGHAIPIAFAAPRDDRAPASALWARVRLARSDDDAEAGRWAGDVVAPLADGALVFGHGMCFGTWPLHPGDRFVARVSAADFALNESAPTALTLEAR